MSENAKRLESTAGRRTPQSGTSFPFLVLLLFLVGGFVRAVSAEPLKIYIVTDLEGASGVYKFTQTREPGHPLGEPAKEYLMGDIAAVVRGLSGMALHDEDLAFLDALPLLEGIAIGSISPLPAVSLRHFAKLHHLNQLSIHDLSHCTGQDLASLNGLGELRGLILTGDIPDSALASLSNLPNLRSVSVHTPEPIQQQTLVDLRQRLERLEYLHVTDAPPGQEATAAPSSSRNENSATRRRQQGRRDRRRR
jgi:hypothetical protein